MPSRQQLRQLVEKLEPSEYLTGLGLLPFEWQLEALNPDVRRMLLLCARQSGKSTVVGGKALGLAKYHGNSLILIISDTQDHSKEVMKKIKMMMTQDRELPEIRYDSTFEVEFDNVSRIIALPGTEKSVRSYSGPKMIIIDEASRVLDDTYRAVRPMMTGADTELVLLSTPYGKRGFFWKAWTEGKHWRRILVIPRYRLSDDGMLVDAGPEEELKASYAKQGISAYYSSRHTKQFLEEELNVLGPRWFRQEYMCSFEDMVGSVFDFDVVQKAFTEEVKPLFGNPISADVKPLFGGR